MAPSHKRRATDNLFSTPKRRRADIEGGSNRARRHQSYEREASTDPEEDLAANSLETPLFPGLEEGEWPVKRLLQKRRRGRGVQYLVEWVDHPLTGERYSTQWVCCAPCSKMVLHLCQLLTTASRYLETKSESNRLQSTRSSRSTRDSRHHPRSLLRAI